MTTDNNSNIPASKPADPTDPTAKAVETASTTTSEPGTEKAIDEIKAKAEELFEMVKRNAGPFFNDLKAKVEPLIADLKETAPQYVEQAKQKAQPLIDDVSAKIDEVRGKTEADYAVAPGLAG